MKEVSGIPVTTQASTEKNATVSNQQGKAQV